MQARLEPAKSAAEEELYGSGGPPADEDAICTRGLYPEAVATWSSVALVAARHGMDSPNPAKMIEGGSLPMSAP